MSDHAFFYNSSNGDRKYDADSFSDWLKQFFTDGVLIGGLQVVASGDMTLNVTAGTGLIGGKVKVFKENTMLNLATASGTYNRIDNVVLRRDDGARDFVLAVVTGTPAANPKAPTLNRTGNVYELCLAQIYVTRGTVKVTQANVTDERPDRSLCGWITGNTEQLPVEQLLAQQDAAFTEWFNAMKGQLSSDAAGNLQNQINTINERIKYGTTLPASANEGDIFIMIES